MQDQENRDQRGPNQDQLPNRRHTDRREIPEQDVNVDKWTNDAMDEIEGPLEDDHDGVDDANEPEGDPGKNVPSA